MKGTTAQNGNPNGHIIRFIEDKKSDTAFAWEVFLLAGDPAYDPLVPAEQPVFGSPDGIWVDDCGIVWIQTDIGGNASFLFGGSNFGPS